MKYIFDFDDVLFNNTKQFKEHMYMSLETVGISRLLAEKYYKSIRNKGFTVKKFISFLYKNLKIKTITQRDLYEKIMGECESFVNKKVVKIVKKLGKENCYIVTHGNKKYQLEKITRTKLEPLFNKIFVVQKSKKQSIESICKKYKNETIFFIDDKQERLQDLDLVKYPNLKTILYTKQDLSILFR